METFRVRFPDDRDILYVATTRAKGYVIVTWHGPPVFF